MAAAELTALMCWETHHLLPQRTQSLTLWWTEVQNQPGHCDTFHVMWTLRVVTEDERKTRTAQFVSLSPKIEVCPPCCSRRCNVHVHHDFSNVIVPVVKKTCDWGADDDEDMKFGILTHVASRHRVALRLRAVGRFWSFLCSRWQN